ncbi:MAG TPA: amidase [Anaerolineales bacterium]|nr:amidase [Anaerolineales bacterium]
MAGPTMRVTELTASFRSGQLRIADYLDRLESYFNEREPSVLSFIPEEGRFDRLQREAAQLIARYPNPDSRPPLFGVPVGVKDIFHVAGFTTRAGSKLPPEEFQGLEAESVTLLRNAGALIMGKTVTTEFAYFGPGPTRNPHNPEHTPGGSSSGSAAAVGAGLCPLTLGTQTIGSVIRPASFCGVVGFKPTYERISRAGVIPLSPSFDHVGLFASDVGGAYLAASALVRDWRLVTMKLHPTLGVPEGPYLEQASAEMLEHFRIACRKLIDAGYNLKSVNVMPDFAEIRERHYLVTAGDAFRVHKNWYPRYRELYHPKTIELLEKGRGVSDEGLAAGIKARDRLRYTLKLAMEKNGVDLWVSPSAVGPAPTGLEATGDPVMNLPWSQAGFPSINLPASRSAEGLPLGLQLIGRWFSDEALFEWAKEIENILHAV